MTEEIYKNKVSLDDAGANQAKTSLEDITAVILVADKDFGRCRTASNLPRALWPLCEKTVLQKLIDDISDQRIKKFVICSSLDSVTLSRAVQTPKDASLKIRQQLFPRGTAGSILDASYLSDTEQLIVFSAEILSPPKIQKILKEHQTGSADMTIMFNPASENTKLFKNPAQIYVCEKTILEYIPAQGYYDIKESLMPVLIRNSRTVHAAILTEDVGNFRTWKEYLQKALDLTAKNNPKPLSHSQPAVSQSAEIAADCRIVGPVCICSEAVIKSGATIIGPAIIGKNVTIDKDSIVSQTVVWDRAMIEQGSYIQKSLIAKDALVKAAEVNQSLVTEKAGLVYSLTENVKDTFANVYDSFKDYARAPLSWLSACKQYLRTNAAAVRWIVAVTVGLTFLWSYWNSVIVDLWKIWLRSDEYSSGLLVPFITVYIVWLRRKDLARCQITPSLWGIVIFIGAQTFRLAGLIFHYPSAERLSMLMTLSALLMLMFGWKLAAKLTTVLLFLTLMLPLPIILHSLVTRPLQSWATTSAVFSLETLGFNVTKEGNVINLNGVTVAVAEACNGLRMITSFFVISAMVAMITNRSWFQKTIIVASAIPVALICNTIRLTATSIAFTQIDSVRWEKAFHDFGGLAMMPVALAIVVFELWLLSSIFVEPQPETETIVKRKQVKEEQQ